MWTFVRDHLRQSEIDPGCEQAALRGRFPISLVLFRGLPKPPEFKERGSWMNAAFRSYRILRDQCFVMLG